MPPHIAPWISVPSASQAVEFYTTAFGCTLRYSLEDAGQVLVAQLQVNGSDADFWLQAEPSVAVLEGGGPMRLILTVDDPDSVFAQAVAAGARVVAEVHEEYGWRIGRIADPFGHHWEIGRQLE